MEAAGPSQSQADDQPVKVVAVSCGSSHSIALLSCDLVMTWGRGEDGQLGHGDADDRSGPEAVHALIQQGVTTVHCGAEYTIAVCRDRQQVYSWGWGDFGRLGHGSCSDCFVPHPIKALSGKSVIGVACGDTHTIAMTSDGSLYGFGRNQNGQLGLGNSTDAVQPVLIQAMKGKRVISVACGAEHTLAALETGELYAWGWGRYGNLGDGEKADRHLPVHVKQLGNVRMRQVSCGWRHSAGITNDGSVYTFGWSKYGQLGHGTYDVGPVHHSLTKLAQGSRAQLNVGFASRDISIPKRVEGLEGVNVVLLSGGWRHAVAADDQGRMWGWGWNKFGQVGIGSTQDSVATPQLIAALQNDKVSQFACGWRHTLALTQQGQMYSWGRGVSGQLGHAETVDLTSPKLLSALSVGTMNLQELRQTARPQHHYIPAADRYAVVPDQAHSQMFGGMSVPQVPTTEVPMSIDRTNQ